MSNFIANFFPSAQGSKQDDAAMSQTSSLQTRGSFNEGTGERPRTPTRDSFITPVATPQGSPSKKSNPPGAHDLPIAFENSMKLNNVPLGTPTKSVRPAGSTPLSPGKSNMMAVDDSYFANATSNFDESVMLKSAAPPGSPVRKQGKENTPPSSRHGESTVPQTHAAMSRQELYQTREAPVPTTKKYNTQRGLTTEELQILQKPNVKRLANVTQLCRFFSIAFGRGTDATRFSRLLL